MSLLSWLPLCQTCHLHIYTLIHTHTHTYTHTLFLSSTHMAYHASISTHENVPTTLTEPADSERPTITLMHKNITTPTHNTHTNNISHTHQPLRHTHSHAHTASSEDSTHTQLHTHMLFHTGTHTPHITNTHYIPRHHHIHNTHARHTPHFVVKYRPEESRQAI